MAEFWPENQSDPTSDKIVKPPHGEEIVTAGFQSDAEEPPTVLSSFKPASSLSPLAQSPAARALGGEMLAHYRLDDYIGVGGMGAVFRATDIRLDRPVALKILPAEQARDTEIVARFQHEARAAARLDHENVARVYFVGEDRGLHFIAFEYVEGVNTRDLIQRCGPLPPHEVLNYALQITGALVHAAMRGVVHRDIKPSNIIIAHSGRAKLVDMGLARHFERRPDGGLTESGVTLGTFDYISPEQARDPRTADIRSDIYSLGCTLFHMLTGRPPYPEGTVLQKLLKHQEESPPDPRPHNPQVPDNFASLIMRMMAKDPARRYQTPQELLTELLEIAAVMGLRSSSPEGLIWVAEPRQKALTKTTLAIWLTAAAALLIAVVALDFPADVSQPTRDIPSARHETALRPATGPETARQELATTGSRVGGDPPESEPEPRPGPPLASDSSPSTQGSNDGTNADAPEVIAVGRDQDLRSVLEKAPSGSVIEINGEYRPQARHWVDDVAGIRIEGKRLTIKAAPGTRPRIVFTLDERDFSVSDWTLLAIVGSQVELEGIQFEVNAQRMEARLISLQSSQVTMRRCSFLQASVPRRPEPLQRDAEPAAIWVAHLDSAIAQAGQVVPSKIIAQECFFGGGDGAFLLEGPGRLELSDCTLLPYRAPIMVRSTGSSPTLAADIRLTNVSLFGSGSPIFELAFARAIVHSQDVVYSHQPPTSGVLARVDGDSRLEWRGKRNMFQGVREYLVSRIGRESIPLAKRLTDWIELSRDVDDQKSVETEQSPWLIGLAEAASKSPDDPHVADAFRLMGPTDDPSWRPPGARYVLPWGPIYAEAGGETSPWNSKVTGYARVDTGQPVPGDSARGPSNSELPTEKVSKPDQASGAGKPSEPSTQAAKLDIKKIMETTPPADATWSGIAGPGAENRTAAETSAPSPQKNTLIVDPQDPAAFHTLAEACARAEDGAVIEIRHRGRLREPPIELGDRHLTIRAVSGFRPVIELGVGQFDLRGREPRLFDIRHGSIALRDLDLRMVVEPTVGADMWSVISSRNADISLENCTVTVEAAAGTASNVVRFLASEVNDPMVQPSDVNPSRPQFQMRQSMVVGVGSLVRMQPAVRLRVELENCAIETQDHLIWVTGGLDRLALSAVHELEMRHSTIKTGSGLVSCEATESRPWLPRLEINAADNIFVGTSGSAWIRFRSPRSADESRGLLRWKGMNNSYDSIEMFWEIDGLAAGEFEQVMWEQWLKSPARDEIKAERGYMEFAESSDSAVPWQRTRNHFKPSPSRTASEMASDGGSRGADLPLIPAPPHERGDQ